MLANYFSAMVGKRLVRKVVTGKTFFTEVYQRNYVFTIIGVEGNNVFFTLESQDVAPSGIPYGGTNIYYGDMKLSVGRYKSVDKFLFQAVKLKDSEFCKRYKVKGFS